LDDDPETSAETEFQIDFTNECENDSITYVSGVDPEYTYDFETEIVISPEF